MISIFCGFAAFLGLFDLFSTPSDRTLPWWGDVIIMVAAAAVYVATRYLLPNEDNS
jgi:hypothetical protein